MPPKKVQQTDLVLLIQVVHHRCIVPDETFHAAHVCPGTVSSQCSYTLLRSTAAGVAPQQRMKPQHVSCVVQSTANSPCKLLQAFARTTIRTHTLSESLCCQRCLASEPPDIRPLQQPVQRRSPPNLVLFVTGSQACMRSPHMSVFPAHLFALPRSAWAGSLSGAQRLK